MARPDAMVRDPEEPTRLRLDQWLDVACLFRSRSEAQRACRGGKVDVGGVRAKPNREIREGESVEIGRPLGRRQKVIVRKLLQHHVPRAIARTMYEDVSPVAPRSQVADWRLGLATPEPRGAGSPDKRARRELRRLKGRPD